MQAFHAALAQDFQGLEADLQMLVDPFAIEAISHAGQLEMTMHRLVGHAEQRAVRHPEAIPVGGDGGALHVERDGARQIETLDQAALLLELPIAVVGGGHRAGAHHRLQLIAGQAGDLGHRLLQRLLDLGQRRQRHPGRQCLVEHVIVARIGMRQHVIAQLLGVPQSGAVAQHQPDMRSQHGEMVGDGLGVRGADADIDQRGARAVGAFEMIGRHLRQARRAGAGHRAVGIQPAIGCHQVARLDEGGIALGPVGHHLQPHADEFVDIELIVGEQDEILEMIGAGRRVMLEALHRQIDARGGEQGQRQASRGMARIGPVGNRIVHAGQIRQVEEVAEHRLLAGIQRRLDETFPRQGEMNRDRPRGQPDRQRPAVILEKQLELFAIIIAEQVGPRQGGAIGAGRRDEPIGQAAVELRRGAAGHLDVRVESPHPFRRILARGKAAEPLGQEADLLGIDLIDTPDRAVGIRVSANRRRRRGRERHF